MPGYKGHLIGGAIAFACLTIALSCWQKPSFFLAIHYFVCALLGSLFPDIDTKSRGQGIFYRIVLIVLAFLLYNGQHYLFMLLSLLAFAPLLVAHRGLFHRPFFLISVPLIIFGICFFSGLVVGPIAFGYTIFFIIGSLSHIFLDKFF